jgi:hypothetical protein
MLPSKNYTVWNGLLPKVRVNDAADNLDDSFGVVWQMNIV